MNHPQRGVKREGEVKGCGQATGTYVMSSKVRAAKALKQSVAPTIVLRRAIAVVGVTLPEHYDWL